MNEGRESTHSTALTWMKGRKRDTPRKRPRSSTQSMMMLRAWHLEGAVGEGEWNMHKYNAHRKHNIITHAHAHASTHKPIARVHPSHTHSQHTTIPSHTATPACIPLYRRLRRVPLRLGVVDSQGRPDVGLIGVVDHQHHDQVPDRGQEPRRHNRVEVRAAHASASRVGLPCSLE
jgi:hypothetical protein